MYSYSLLGQRVAMSGLGEYGEARLQARAKAPERITLRAGTTLFKQGEVADAAYILETGGVQIFKMISGKRIVLGTVREWSLFGEMGLIDDSPRMASAYVTEDSTCTVISKEAFSRMLDSAPDGMLLVVESLTRTLRASSDNLAEARYQISELERS
jgi:CRP/FNR family cyclic AMP-dependent transcriptional regulator